MIDVTWSMLRNTMDNVTKFNLKRMLLMSKDHHDKLLAKSGSDAVVLGEYNFFRPFHLDFTTKYAAVTSITGQYHGQTMRVEKLYGDLSGTLIKKWDVGIQNVFPDDTPEYGTLLPNRRTPFQSGTYENRYMELLSLETNLALYPSLSSILNEVTAFRTNLGNVRTTQQGLEFTLSDARNQAEAARFLLAQAMHGVFGALIRHYWNDPGQVETFYELQYLRTPTTADDTNPVAGQSADIYLQPSESKAVLTGNYTPNTLFELEITGGALAVQLTEKEENPYDPNVPMLPEGAHQNYLATDLSDGSPMRVLMAYNNTNALVRIRAKEVVKKK